MSKLAQLREHRNTIAQAANTLNAKFPADQRMPPAEAAKLDEYLGQLEGIDADISRETRVAQLAMEQTDNLLNRARENATRDPSKHSEHAQALRAYMQGGVANLSPEQHAELGRRQNEDIRQAMNPMSIRGAMSTTTPAEGGYTVATEYMRSLEVAMKSYGAMLDAGDTIRTGTGAQMQFPTSDPTGEIGEIVGQNTATTALDTPVGNISLDVYKYSSKKIALPWELVQDSFIDFEAYIQEILAMRLGRIMGLHCTTGTGIGQPRGLMTAVNTGKTGTTGQTTTVTYDDLIDLEHSVDPSYRAMPGVGYMMHDTSLAKIRKIKDSNARPIFVPGYETGNPGGAPDRLLGRPIFINQDMPVMAANAKSIAFGAFKKYKIRKVMDLTVFRMTDSAFTLNGQIGFVAFQRLGGNFIDAGGAVKTYVNSAT